MRLLLINPRYPESFWSFRFALERILPGKRAITPPLGLATLDVRVDDGLAARLKNEPGNAEGWLMLARSYSVLGQFEPAIAAYRHVLTLEPKNAQALADLADALAVTNGGRHRGTKLDSGSSVARQEKRVLTNQSRPPAP